MIRWIVALLIFLMAAVFRFFQLSAKPIHHDEAVNGWITAQSWVNGFVNYDPTNFHGALLFWIYQLAELIGGARIESYRSVSVLFALGSLVLLLYAFERLTWGAILTGFVFALSPAFFFFSRSAIHEMPFLFFQILFVAAVLQVSDKASRDRMLLPALIGLIGMILLKETFVLLCAGVVVVLLLEPKLRAIYLDKDLKWLIPFLAPFGVLLFIQSSGFQNWSDVPDLVIAFLPWLKTGTDLSGHAKPWYFWIEILAQYEPALVFGLLLSVIGAFRQEIQLRLASRFALVVFAFYSLIPYKTIWCIVSLSWLPLVVIVYFWASLEAKTRVGMAVILVSLTFFSVKQIPTLVQSNYHSQTHPYFYVETSTETMKLFSDLRKIFSERPLLMDKRVVWQAKEVWPWPWLVQDMDDQDSVVELSDAHIQAGLIFASVAEAEAKAALFSETHQILRMPLRVEGPQIAILVRKEILK